LRRIRRFSVLLGRLLPTQSGRCHWRLTVGHIRISHGYGLYCAGPWSHSSAARLWQDRPQFDNLLTADDLGYDAFLSSHSGLVGATELLLPLGSSPDTDWQSHFFSVRKWFYSVVCIFTVLAALESHILLNVPLAHPYRIMQLTVLLAAATGFLVKSPRSHLWISAIYLGNLLVSQVLFRLQPGLSQ
jgi:hypothetical protein